MLILVLFFCALATASATYTAPYHGPVHIPVIGPNGVPLETPEVQQARASHLAALAEAGSRGGYYGSGYAGAYSPAPAYGPGPGAYSPYAAAPTPIRHTPPAYPTTYGIPAIAANGIPLDTPEVEAAKANHFAAYAQANAALASAPGAHGYGAHGYGHYRRRRSIDSTSLLAALTGPLAGHLGLAAPALAYKIAAYPQHIPVIDSNGVPVEPAEVQQARAAHLAAYSATAARNGLAHTAAAIYAPAIAYGAPAIGPHGAPIDTPEVQAAKAAHLAAHAAARGHY